MIWIADFYRIIFTNVKRSHRRKMSFDRAWIIVSWCCCRIIFPAVGISLPPTYSLTSPYRDTDSGNDSFESDTSSRMDASNESTTSEERNKWSEHVNDSSTIWKQKVAETSIWQRKSENDWSITSKSHEQSNRWPVLNSNSEHFLKNLMCPSVTHKELPPPPKPDSPTEVYSDILIF